GPGMSIESDDLANLRDTTSRLLMGMLWVHVPIAVVVGLMRGMDWLMPATLMAAMASAATASWRLTGNGLSTRLVFGFARMAYVSVLVLQMQGNPWELDIHMYFSAALACLMSYCEYRPILAATVAVAVHHLLLNFVLPAALYPGSSDFARVVLHAV